MGDIERTEKYDLKVICIIATVKFVYYSCIINFPFIFNTAYNHDQITTRTIANENSKIIHHSYLKDMVWKPIEIGFCYDLYQRTGRNKLQKMGC